MFAPTRAVHGLGRAGGEKEIEPKGIIRVGSDWVQSNFATQPDYEWVGSALVLGSNHRKLCKNGDVRTGKKEDEKQRCRYSDQEKHRK